MKVSIRIFDREESAFLSILIDQAAKRLNLPVSYCEVSGADVVFLKEEEPGAEILLRSTRVSERPITVLYGQGAHPWTLERPATSKNLMPLLSRLGERLASHVPVLSESVEPPTEEAPALLAVSRGAPLLQRLLACQAHGGVWHCSLAGAMPLLLDYPRGVVRAPRELADDVAALAEQLLAAPADGFAPLDEGFVYPAELVERSLEELLWRVGQIAELALPLSEAALHAPFRLTRWPTFSRINVETGYINLAGRLVRGAASLAQLTAHAEEALPSVARFYNSALLCGLIKTEPSTPPAVAPAVPEDPNTTVETRMERASVFQRILKRLVG